MFAKRSLVALCILGCAACEDSGQADHASSFTGDWNLSGTTVALMPAGAAPAPIPGWLGPTRIESTDLATVRVPRVCPGGEAVPMEVAGPGRLAGRAFACPPFVEPGCTEPTEVALDGGAGTQSAGALVIAFTGTYRSCQGSHVFSLVLVGTRN